MSPRITAAGLAAVVAFAGAAQAQVTFFAQEGYTGRSMVVGGADPDLARSRFDDRASSVIVDRGRWEVCEHPGYGGRCAVLRPGQYPSLAAIGLDDRISSVRPLRRAPQGAPAPAPSASPPYAYYPRHGEPLYQADVVDVRAVVGPPEQRCWIERERVGRDRPNVPGAILGGVIGGVLGHQIGGGSGRDVATALGAVGGVALGAHAGRGGASVDVQRCEAVPGTQPVYWDVSYVFRGREYRTQLAFEPGRTIAVNGRGEPRM